MTVVPPLLIAGVQSVNVPEAEQNTVSLPVPQVGPISRLVICTPLRRLVNVIVKYSTEMLVFHVSKPKPMFGVPQLVNDGVRGSWVLEPVPQRGLVLCNGAGATWPRRKQLPADHSTLDDKAGLIGAATVNARVAGHSER